MTKSGLPKSIRKFIRLEKARIRTTVLDTKKQEEMIRELYNKFIANKTGAKTSADNQRTEDNFSSKPKVQISNQSSAYADPPATPAARAGSSANRQNPKSKATGKRNNKELKTKSKPLPSRKTGKKQRP